MGNIKKARLRFGFWLSIWENISESEISTTIIICNKGECLFKLSPITIISNQFRFLSHNQLVENIQVLRLRLLAHNLSDSN